MTEFQTMVSAMDDGGIGIMMDGTFNHSAPDCILGQGAQDLFPWVTNKTSEIRQDRYQWFARAGALDQPASFYQGNQNNDIATAPDRIDFGKWADVREFYFGSYDCLVKGGTAGDTTSRHFNEYQSERDYFFGHQNQYSRETWEYFAYYPQYWLEQTGHPAGTPKTESHKGIDGLRCDFAQGLPNQFWEYCINKTRSIKWKFLFMAESLDGSRTINGNPRHGVGYRSSRHFDILNENMVFAWRDTFFNYQVSGGGGAGGSANPSTSFLINEFNKRRDAFDGSPVLLNLTSHDEVFPSDDPYRMAYAYAIIAAMDGAPMLMYGQEAGAQNDVINYPNGISNNDHNWERYEVNFGKSIPNFKRYNHMQNIWNNRDWNLQSLLGRIGEARKNAPALRSQNNHFLDRTSFLGKDERIFAVAKFMQAGTPVEQQDVVFVFINNDYVDNPNRSATYWVGDESSPGINKYGINPVHSYNVQDLISTNPTALVWASNKSGTDLINNGLSIGLPYQGQHAQYLRLVNMTVPVSDNDNDGIPDHLDWDDDNDGLSDDFENAHGLDPNDATGDNGANGDPDGDSLTNAQEQDAGTHPNQANSNLSAYITKEPGQLLKISWDSIPGKIYTLQRATNLESGNQNWAPVFTGTAFQIQSFITETIPTNQNRWYYRVQVLP